MSVNDAPANAGDAIRNFYLIPRGCRRLLHHGGDVAGFQIQLSFGDDISAGLEGGQLVHAQNCILPNANDILGGRRLMRSRIQRHQKPDRSRRARRVVQNRNNGIAFAQHEIDI